MDAYEQFLARKVFEDRPSGFDAPDALLHPGGEYELFQFQKPIVKWAIKRGRAAIFADTGLGKTAMQSIWSYAVHQHTGNRVLILAPLCVAPQTVAEAEKFGVRIRYVREMPEQGDTGIFITNYEMLEHFEEWIERGYFDGVVLDESSILKSQDSKTRARITAVCQRIPYRLSCTATPSPNDYMELGNQAEFLGVMSNAEMLATFFTHNTGQLADNDKAKWRLKGHGKTRFWEWMSHWATFIRKPSDLGFEDSGYNLPPLEIDEIVVQTGLPLAQTLSERNEARAKTVQSRCEAVKERIYGKSTIAGLVSREQERDRYGETKDLHEVLLPVESVKVETIEGSARKDQCQTSGCICSVSRNQTKSEICSSGVAESEPGKAEIPEVEVVRSDLREFSDHDGDAGESLRYLCDSGERKSEILPCSGSLPQDGQSARTSMRSMQFGAGTVSRRHRDDGLRDDVSRRTTPTDSILIWCHRNSEQDLLEEFFGEDAVSIHGSTSIEDRERFELAWRNGEVPILITKPKCFGFGMNWQHCSRMIFVGLNDSYEQLYQAIRRCYRFGQTKPVRVTFITADCEGAVRDNIRRKEQQAEEMSRQMIQHMRDFCRREVLSSTQQKGIYARDLVQGSDFTLHLGDCVDVARELPDESIDFSVFSPPFASLFTYSNLDRDMGNSKSHRIFWDHFEFLVRELYRAMRSGRNVSVHCANLPATKGFDGFIGLKDFRGDIIRLFEKAGFYFHSEVTIWKDPVVAMQRTKAIGLLWKQIKKDSSLSRQGIPDYVVTFRKPGDNTRRLHHTPEEFPVHLWQELASPCWNDIRQSNTLNRKLAREENDERHICPLQLDLIERLCFLWSIPGDTVFSPFAGIGSEGYVATSMGRKFIGSELKRSYFEIAAQNLAQAPRSEYRFPHFSEKVGKWHPDQSAPKPLTVEIPAIEESCKSQLDWLSGALSGPSEASA